MANKLNFSVSDKLVVNGYDGIVVDTATDWASVELAMPISTDGTKAHPFVDGETFLGILSSKQIQDPESEIVGVNTIELSYLKGGYFFWVRADGVVAIGEGLTPTAKGFKKEMDTTKIKCYAVSSGKDGEAIKVRGGNY